MAVKLNLNDSFLCVSSSNPWPSQDQRSSGKKVSDFDLHCVLSKCGSSRKRYLIGNAVLWNADHGLVDCRNSSNPWPSQDQRSSGKKVSDFDLHCVLSKCGSSRKRYLIGNAVLWNADHGLVDCRNSSNPWPSQDQRSSGKKVSDFDLHCVLSKCGSSRKRYLIGNAVLWNADHGLVDCRNSSNPWPSQDQQSSGKKVSDFDLHCVLSKWGSSRKRYLIRNAVLWNANHGLVDCRKYCYTFSKRRKMPYLLPFASADDGDTVNGNPQASTSTDLEKLRVKLNMSLEDQDFCDELLQSLYDAARVFELAIKEQKSFSRVSWFSTAWLGIDQNAWVKALSYQAAVYSLLQAASEIPSRSDGQDRNTNVQRSLLRLSASLESLIREKLSAKQPEVYEWFWSEQVPAVVISFLNKFEGDANFTVATTLSGKNKSPGSGSASDISLLGLALTCITATMKLGPAKISCSQFLSMIKEITGSLMDMLVDLIPISQAYNFVKGVGLHREFLVHFGPRAAASRVKVKRGSEEVIFWVNLAQRHLQKAIAKEKIWSRLTTSESIEVLEKDLAIFGFFVALGRSTRSFLSANGFHVLDDPVEVFIRYLIGGSVLYYPQLSSISSYQLYVEVVCEELDWLPFYRGHIITTKQLHGHRSKQEGPPNAEALPRALDVCSHWMQSFIKYSTWLESPSNVKAVKFLSIGHNKLMECMEELGTKRNNTLESDVKRAVDRNRSMIFSSSKESDSFDKALESVEEAVLKLEKLLQELNLSSVSSGKEHLKAACSDLEKIRKLKKEAEFLEAPFRTKADSLQQENYIERSSSNAGVADLEFSEIGCFKLLRNELIELEKRVQSSAYRSENDEDTVVTDDGASYGNAGGVQMVQVQKGKNILEKSFGKLKETSTDVWQGTQLLAIDVAAAMGLLRRALMEDELTEKEKKTLKRTLTDLASVVPIGFLMLLPVTAVGYAAILAAIQRYVPALIPSTYAPERLDLLRQLEKVKEMTFGDMNSDEKMEEVT